ncbi:MAG: SGNH/GDSL hydrolase family protein [Microthrixaceae bacterium]
MITRSTTLRSLPPLVGIVIAVGLAVSGRRSQAVLVVVLVVALVVAGRLGVDVVGVLARSVGTLFAKVGFGVVGLAVAVGGIVSGAARRPALPGVPSGDSAWRWSSRATREDSSPRRPFAPDDAAPPVGLVRRFSRLVGVVVILATINLLVGLAFERTRAVVPARFADVVNITGSKDPPRDPRQDLPAMADAPWREELFHEMQVNPGHYWPFTTYKPSNYRSRYLNISGWARATYVPRRLDRSRAPIVWMFGGSTTWGEAQRDDFTIASELSKLAERAGTPIVVRNFGQRGWVLFQEMILFEQLSAHGRGPDLVVFYDGANEMAAQQQFAKGVPSTGQADNIAKAVDGHVSGVSTNAAVSAWRSYSRHSALHMVARWLRRVLDPPAGAAIAQQIEYPPPTAADADRAADVYRRARMMTTALAVERGAVPLFFLQPVRHSAVGSRMYSRIGPPSIDVSDVLDGHEEVYLDGNHHNEKGARIVAARLWHTLAPRVSAVSDRLARSPEPDRATRR